MKCSYKTQNTCCKLIEFDLNGDIVTNVQFLGGGCPGNLQALPKLVEGMTVKEIENKYELILIDTPGINPFVPEDVGKVSAFVEAVSADAILTMASGLNTYEAIEIAEVFTELGARYLMPTRMDLTRRIGALLSVASCCELGFCSAGVSASIAKGLAEITPRSLARLILE